MSLKARITEDMKSAMRAGEKDRLSCIRMLQAGWEIRSRGNASPQLKSRALFMEIIADSWRILDVKPMHVFASCSVAIN